MSQNGHYLTDRFGHLDCHTRQNISLASRTSIGVGGEVPWFIQPRSEDTLLRVLAILREESHPWRVIGAGTNLIVRQEPFTTALLELSAFESVVLKGDRLQVGSGVKLPRLSMEMAKAGLSGLEFAVGIPGTIGGAIRTNAGTPQAEMADVVEEVRVVVDGAMKTLSAPSLDFTYRRCALPREAVVVGATLCLTLSKPQRVLRTVRENMSYRNRTQPVREKTAGCIFRNPPGKSAGAVIQEVGLAGHRIGNARISELHSNFIINEGGACVSDVLDLIRIMEHRVLDSKGIQLRREVEIWGDEPARGGEA